MAISATPEGLTTVKLTFPKVVQCAFYYETSQGDGMFSAGVLARKANELLLPHNMELRVYRELRGLSVPGLTLTYDQKIYSGTEDETASIFKVAKAVYDPPRNILPVIFCTIASVGTAGSTKTVVAEDRKVVLIFMNTPSSDDVTLLHEIGHAAGREHVIWKKNGTLENILCTPFDLAVSDVGKFPRGAMTPEDVKAFDSAPFAVKVNECSLLAL